VTTSDFDVRPLLDSVAGPVLLPHDEGFAAECAGFNLLVVHDPAVVVGATSAADVRAAVRFAVANGLPVAVLATGHQPFPPATGSVLITTGRMASVEVDAERRTARVTAGTLWQQVVDSAAKDGLAPLSGSAGTVGVIGYVLGGGLSPTMGRTHGWAADHVRGIDVVTADGESRHVTELSDPDLFWAIRGGKGNFGVVTAIDIALFPVTEYFGGGVFYAGEHTAAVLHAYREWIADAPDELNSSIGLLRLPPLPTVPEFAQGKLVVHLRVSYLGSEEDGERLVAPMRAVAPALLDTVATTPYTEFASIHLDPTDPMPYGEFGGLLTELSAEGVDRIVELAGPASDCRVVILDIRHLGGALGRPAASPNAVDVRDARINVWGAAVGDPVEVGAVLDRMRDLVGALAPWSTGRQYLNFMSGDDAVENAFGDEVFRRLRTVKSQYDPTNVFRANNHNVLPNA